MATIMQKKLAENIVKAARAGKRLNKKQLVVLSGYSPISAESSAHIILEQKGVQEELENLGFDTDSAKKVVKSILKSGKDENKLKAADMIFKVVGDYAPEKHVMLSKIVSVDE